MLNMARQQIIGFITRNYKILLIPFYFLRKGINFCDYNCDFYKTLSLDKVLETIKYARLYLELDTASRFNIFL